MKRYLKKIEDKSNLGKIENIDFIYLINLDRRPEKLARTMQQFARFGLKPHRFSAIDGWGLSEEAIQECALRFGLGMDGGRDKILKPVLYPGSKTREIFEAQHLGRGCFYPRTSLGAFGCTLSHLSILQDAYEAGHEVVWVLEDDCILKSDPRALGGYVEALSSLAPDWDVLYTDHRGCFEAFTPGTVWRPDMPSRPLEALSSQKRVSSDFFQIGGRSQTYSMIVKRSGMKKILDFYLQQGMFLPYDIDLAFIPDIRLYTLTANVVEGEGDLGPSDTDAVLERAFITCKIYGSLGDQLFQTAAALGYAWDHDALPVFPELLARKDHNIALHREKVFFRLDPSHPTRHWQNRFDEADPKAGIPKRRDLALFGTFRSWRYFDRHRKKIQDCFSLTKEVRQCVGMYLCKRDLAPLRHAIALFPNRRFLCISDDPEACRALFEGKEAECLPKGAEHEDLALLSQTKDAIVGSESLGWWAAYLHQSPDKRVVALYRDPNYFLPEWESQ